MKSKDFIILVLIYIALGASWESTGVAVFAAKFVGNVSTQQINALSIIQYAAVLITGSFCYLFLQTHSIRTILLSSIAVTMLTIILYVAFPIYSLLLLFYAVLGVSLACIKSSLYVYVQHHSSQQQDVSKQLNFLEGFFFLGPFLFYLLSGYLIDKSPYLWRLAYLIPLLFFSICLVALFLYRDNFNFQLNSQLKKRLVIAQFIRSIRAVPVVIILLLIFVFAISGILNVWSPSLIYHYTHLKGISIFINTYTFIALIVGRIISGFLSKIIKIKILLSVSSCLLVVCVILFMFTHIPYLIPLFSLFLGPTLIFVSSLLLTQIESKDKYYLAFWVLIISSLGDIVGVRVIGSFIKIIPFHDTFTLILSMSIGVTLLSLCLFRRTKTI